MEPLYPKTDETLWLRTCEEEVIEPIEGRNSGTVSKFSSFQNFSNII